jgi:glycosyltransferase involved in cell wall biosynthesis
VRCAGPHQRQAEPTSASLSKAGTLWRAAHPARGGPHPSLVCWPLAGQVCVHCDVALGAHAERVRINRVIGVLEPGGAQLSMLRLARAQAVFGVETRLLAGDATPQGVALAEQFGFEPDVLQMHTEIGHSRRQWTPDPVFAHWLAERMTAVDLVHAHMFGAWWAATRSAPMRVPVIASEHNGLTWPLGDFGHSAALAGSRVDRFFSHGPGAQADVGRLGVEAAKLLTGKSAISSHNTPRPGLASPRLTFTGRLREDKGPDLLLHALAAMHDPPTTYVVGDGPMSQTLRRLVDRLGLRRVVQFTGWSYEPARYVAGAAVHVVPSREEAWSQSAVTALALGVPVVACLVDGLPTTLAERRGLLVSPQPEALAAAIQTVLDGDADIDTAEGRRYASSFQPAQIASEYFAVYQQAIVERSTDPLAIGPRRVAAGG